MENHPTLTLQPCGHILCYREAEERTFWLHFSALPFKTQKGFLPHDKLNLKFRELLPGDLHPRSDTAEGLWLADTLQH